MLQGKMSTQLAVFMCVLVIVLGVMAYMKVEFDTVGLLAILAALGFVGQKLVENNARTEQVQQQTNGNTHQMQATITQAMEEQRRMTEQLMRILAVSQPITHEMLAITTAEVKPVSAPPDPGPTVPVESGSTVALPVYREHSGPLG